jgi:hypothetical protein
MGVTANLALTYDPAADEGAATKGAQNTTNVSGNAVVLELAHDSGVSLGFGQESIDNGSVGAGGSDEESLTGYIKYAMGPVSVGYQEAQQNTANGGQDLSAELWGIAYTAGNVSVSYAESELY